MSLTSYSETITTGKSDNSADKVLYLSKCSNLDPKSEKACLKVLASHTSSIKKKDPTILILLTLANFNFSNFKTLLFLEFSNFFSDFLHFPLISRPAS